jgi:hypothetical protein
VKEAFEMEYKIPPVIDELYRYFVTEPDPQCWPEYVRNNPTLAHGLWSFYQGLCLGMQLSEACREQQ